jgi:hypothetical protein
MLHLDDALRHSLEGTMSTENLWMKHLPAPGRRDSSQHMRKFFVRRLQARNDKQFPKTS